MRAAPFAPTPTPVPLFQLNSSGPSPLVSADRQASDRQASIYLGDMGSHTNLKSGCCMLYGVNAHGAMASRFQGDPQGFGDCGQAGIPIVLTGTQGGGTVTIQEHSCAVMTTQTAGGEEANVLLNGLNTGLMDEISIRIHADHVKTGHRTRCGTARQAIT